MTVRAEPSREVIVGAGILNPELGVEYGRTHLGDLG